MLRSPVRLSSPIFRYVEMAGDILIIWAGGLWASYYTRGSIFYEDMPLDYRLLVLVGSLILTLFSDSIYRSWRVDDLGVMIHSVVMAWLGSVMFLVLWLYMMKSSADFSRAWMVAWVFITLGGLCAKRLAVHTGLRWLRQKGYNFRTVVLIGNTPTSEHVRHALTQSAWSGLRVVATLEPADVKAYVEASGKQRQPDEVWLCLPLGDKPGILTTLDALRHSTANIRLVPDMFALKLVNHGVSEVVGVPMLDLSASPIIGSRRLLKALEDFLVSTLILVLISPLMVAIAIAVKVSSPGPILYRQKRHGWNGEEITVYKFRSMRVHDEGGKVTQARKNDSRITKVGAFLRRTSLDELPQFINVMQGRMSVVGPRPHAVVHNEEYKELVPGYMLRHKVKPGITGWAQIHGLRGETDTLDKMQRRVEYDLFYIENLSLWLDLKIIFATIFKGFVNNNAY